MSLAWYIEITPIFQNFNTNFGLFWAILAYFRPFLSKSQQNLWFEPSVRKNKNFWRQTNTYITKYKQFGWLYQRMGKIVIQSQAGTKLKVFVSFSPRRSPESWKKLFSYQKYEKFLTSCRLWPIWRPRVHCLPPNKNSVNVL